MNLSQKNLNQGFTFNLTQKLIFVFALVFLLFFLLVGFIAQKILEKQVVSNMHESISVLAIDEGEDIQEHFGKIENLGVKSRDRIKKWLSHTPTQLELQDFDRKFQHINGALRTNLNAYPDDDISAIFLSSKSELNDEIKQIIISTESCFEEYARGISSFVFNMYLITRHQLIRIYKHDWAMEIEPDHDFTQDIFYNIAEPINNPDQSTRWTAPYYDSIWKHWMTSLITPIYIGGAFLGIVGHDVILDDIYKEILSKKYYNTGYGFIFDKKKNIVIHPNHLNRLQKTAKMGSALHFTELSNLELAHVISGIVNKEPSNKKIHIESFHENDELNYLFAYDLDFQDWYFAIVVPHNEIVKMLPEFQRNFILGAVFISLVLFLVIVLLIWIYVISPIKTLTRATKEIRSGNLKHRASIKSNDEIGELAISFNDMANILSDTLDDLQNDISERKRFESELQESEERYRSLISNIPIGLYRNTPGPKGRFITANHAIAKMFGYESVEDFLQINVSDLYINPSMRAKFSDKLLSQGQVIDEQFQFTKKDGTTIWGSVSANVVKDQSGKIIYYDGLIEDITEKIHVESELKKSEERFRSLVETTSDWIWETDINSLFTYVSPQVKNVLGYDPEELLGNSIFDLMPTDEAPKIASRLNEYVKAEKPFNHLINVSLHKDNHKVILESCGLPFYDSDGKFVGYRGIDRDITERKQIEEELLKVKKLESVGILAGGIAHDFNNLLTSIIGNISLAKYLLDPSSEIFKRLSQAELASLRAKDLTQQLLTFSKGGDPVKKTASIEEIVRKTCSFTLSGSKVRCKYDFVDDLLLVEVDKGQLSQVIQNLIINAIQAMPKGGEIIIKGENVTLKDDRDEHTLNLLAGDYVRLSIHDQGIGIAKEHLSKIFDPYFTTKEKGSGLGLATSFSIISKHGGTIFAHSPEKGTVFTIYLPASSNKIEKSTKVNAIKEFTGQGHILIMDDEQLILDVTRDILQNIGYEVECANDGVEATKSYTEALKTDNKFDVVIMDLTIPGGMGGEEAVGQLLKIDPDVKALVSSGYSSDPIMANYQDYGFCGVVTKPYHMEELNQILQHIISTKIS